MYIRPKKGNIFISKGKQMEVIKLTFHRHYQTQGNFKKSYISSSPNLPTKNRKRHLKKKLKQLNPCKI